MRRKGARKTQSVFQTWYQSPCYMVSDTMGACISLVEEHAKPRTNRVYVIFTECYFWFLQVPWSLIFVRVCLWWEVKVAIETGGIANGDYWLSDQQIDFLLGKYWVEILHLNIFVNFRPQGDNVFTHFYLSMDYSDTLMNFDSGESLRRFESTKSVSHLSQCRLGPAEAGFKPIWEHWTLCGQAPKWDLEDKLSTAQFPQPVSARNYAPWLIRFVSESIEVWRHLQYP